MNHLKLTELTSDQAIASWDVLAPMLDKAIQKGGEGRFTIHDIRRTVAEGLMLILAIWDPERKAVYAVLGCEGSHLPGKRVFTITLCGGAKAREWMHLYPAVRHIALSKGYDQIEVCGRKGWARLFEDLPFREAGTFWIDDFTDIRAEAQKAQEHGV